MLIEYVRKNHTPARSGIHFVVITLTTIGYGDFALTKPVTKILTIFYGLNGIVLILMLFDVIRTLRGWEIGGVAKKDVEE